MTQKEIIYETKWLTSWGKWLRKKYLTVEKERKPFYNQLILDTFNILKSYDIYHAEEKEYSLDELW